MWVLLTKWSGVNFNEHELLESNEYKRNINVDDKFYFV